MADRYWVGGTGTWNTTSTTNWSASPGGASGATVPTAADSVFFDRTGAYTVTMTGALNCLDITVSAGAVTFTSTGTLSIRGSLSFIAGTVWNTTGLLTFTASDARTIQTAGTVFNSSITFNSTGGTGTVSLLSNLTLSPAGILTLNFGTLSLGSYTFSAGGFVSNVSQLRTLDFGTGKLVLNGSITTTIWNTSTGSSGPTILGTPLVECTGGGTAVTKTIQVATTNTTNPNNPINFSFLETSGTVTYAFTSGNTVGNLIFNGVQTISNIAINIRGNLTHQTTNGTTTFTAGTSAWTFAAPSGSNTITPVAGFIYDFPWIFGTATSTAAWTLAANLTLGSTRTVTLTGGTLLLSSFVLSAGLFSSTNSNTRTLNFGTGKIVLNGSATATVWTTATNTNLTLTGTPLVECSGGGTSVTKTITTGAMTEASAINFSFLDTGGTPTYALTNLSTFKNLIVNGSQTITNSGAITIFGNYTHSTTNGTTTFTASTSAWTFAATSGSYTITTGAVTHDFPWDFGVVGTTATWTLNSNVTLGTARSATLTAGTLALGTFTFTAGQFNSNNSNARTIDFGTGKFALITTTALTIWNTQSATGLTVSGTPLVECSGAGAVTKTINTGNSTESQSISFSLLNTGAAPTYVFSVGSAVRNLITNGVQTVSNASLTLYGTWTHLTANGTTTFAAGGLAWSFLASSGSYTITPVAGVTYDFPINIGAAGTTATYALGANLAVGATRQLTLNNGTIDFNNRSIGGNVTFGNASNITLLNTGSTTASWTAAITHAAGSLTLPFNLTTTSTAGYTLTAGTLALGTFNLTTPVFSSNNSNARTINFGTGTIALVGSVTATVWNTLNRTGLTVLGTPNVTSSGGSTTVTKTFAMGFAPWGSGTYNLSLLETTGSVTYVFTQNDTVNNLTINGLQTVTIPTATNIPALKVYGNYTYAATNGTTTFTTSTAGIVFAGNTGTTVNTGGVSTAYPMVFNAGNGKPAVRVQGSLSNTLANDTGGYVGFPYTAFNQNGSAIYTIEFWINFNSIPTGSLNLLQNGRLGAALSATFSGTTATFGISHAGFSQYGVNAVFDVPLQQWHHIAIIGNSANTWIAVNGSVKPFGSVWGEGSYTPNGSFPAGRFYSGAHSGGYTDLYSLYGGYASSTYDYYISQFRIATGTVLIYNTTGFNPPAMPLNLTGVSGICLSITDTNYFRDLSASNGTIDVGSINNTAATTPTLQWIGSSSSAPTIRLLNDLNLGGQAMNITNGNIDINGRTVTASSITIVGGGDSTIWNTGSASYTTTVPITHTAGNLLLTMPITTTSAAGYTLTGGNLSLGSLTLTARTFASSNTNTRTINFGTGKIVLNSAISTGAMWNTAINTNLTISGTPLVECLGGGGSDSGPGQASKNINTGAMTEANSISFSFLDTTDFVQYTFTNGSVVRNLIFNGSQRVGNYAITIYGSFTHQNTNGTTTFIANTNAWTFAATSGSHNITPVAGYVYDFPWTFNGTGGTWILQNNLALGGLKALTWTNGTLDFNNRTLTGTNGITMITGTFTVNNTGGAALTTAAPITQTSGTLNLGTNLTTSNLTGYTLTAGALNLNGFNLTTSIFSSSNGNTRSIAFGANNIILATTTAAQVNLAMADATNFTETGTGGFSAAADITRTFTFGTTGGTTTNAPNLTLTGTGTAVGTFTSGSSFNTLNFGTTAFAVPATAISTNNLILSTGGTYTGLSVNKFGTGTITPNGKTIAALTINHTGTTTLAGPLACTTYTQTAGTLDFATFNLTCSSTATYTAGTLSNIGTIACTTWTCNNTFTLVQGTIAPSVSFVVASGGFNYNGGTLSAVPAFTQNAGTVSFGQSYALTATGTYTLNAGRLTLNDFALTTGIFSSNNASNREIAFGTGNIVLSHATAAQTVLDLANATNFNWTGTGGFRSDAAVTRTFSFGTTGGTFYNAPNLAIVSGNQIPTFTNNSWFDILDFTGSSCAPAAATINVDTLTLATGGTYTALIPQFTRTQTWTAQFGKQLGGIGINRLFNTLTLDGTQTFTATSTCSVVTGTLDLGGSNLTVGRFSSSGPAPRAVVFGNNNIVLNHSTAAQTVLAVADATNFLYTSTGGGFVSDAAVTRTFSFGNTTGGNVSNAPNLLINSGSAIPTITDGSWFNQLDFTGSTVTPAVSTVNVNSLTLSSSGTFTSISVNVRASGVIVPNGKTIAALTINHDQSGTTTLLGALTCTTQSYVNGNVDFAGFNLTGTAATYNGGVFSNLGVLACTTFTIAGNFELITGTISPSTSIVLSSGSLRYTGGTLSPVGTFTHTAGTVVLNKNLALTATGTYTLATGSLNLNNNNLTTGIFSSTGTGARSIAFGTGNIVLAHTTAATTVLSMADATNFTESGTGGFVSDAAVTRTYTFGTTGGSATNAPNLAINSGGATQTLGNSWFNIVDFTGSTCAPTSPASGGTQVSTLILASGGTYTSFAPIFTRSQTWSAQHGKQLGGFGLRNSATVTLDGTQTFPDTGYVRFFDGTLDLGGYDLTTGAVYGNDGAGIRSIAFGSNNIILVWPNAGGNRIDIPNATNFTCTGTGGFLSAATVTATFVFGTTGGTATNGPNLTFTGSGTAVQTLTTGGWFNKLDFGTTAFNPGTTSLNLGSLTLSSSGTYTGLTATMVGTGTLIGNDKPTNNLIINHTGTTTLGSFMTLVPTATATLTSGTLDLAGFTLTTGAFSSSNTNTRSIQFGTGNIVLWHTTAATMVLSMAIATNFTWTGTGGFRTDAAVTRTFEFGTTGGTVSNALNLAIASGASVPTMRGGCWFKVLDFTGSTCTPFASAFNVDTLILATGGTYTALIPMFTRTQTWTSQFSKQLGGIGVNAGAVLTLDNTQTYTTTAECILIAGTLVLGGVNLTVGTFSSSYSNTRAVAFGANNIVLATTTAAAVNLAMANATNFSYTGTGGFTAAADITRTFTFGTTGGTAANAPRLALTSGTAIPTLTSGSWFDVLDFGTTAFVLAATTLNLDGLTLSTGGTFTNLTVNMVGTGTITPNGKTIASLNNINHTGTTTLAGALATAATATTTLTSGTLNLNNFTLTTGTFSSSNTNTRSIAFGTGNIVLAHTTDATNALAMADATNFTCTGTGGFTSAMSLARIFRFGTTGGTSVTAPNLSLTSGAAVPTLTTGSWFNTLNFTGTTSTPAATTVNVNSLILAAGGTYTGLTVNMVGTGTVTSAGKTIAALNVNSNNPALVSYKVYRFTSSGSITFPVSNAPPSVEYLIVAGGGGGGGHFAGGGGAGGLLSGTTPVSAAIEYTVTVGAGGAGGLPFPANDGGQNGLDSVFSAVSISAIGGGGGGTRINNTGFIGKNGGSGGGGGNENGVTAGTGTASQGNNGGVGFNSAAASAGGGGGGAGGAGGAGGSNTGGAAGAGITSSFSGAAVIYAVGGGGASGTVRGTAGSGVNTGGGGAGSQSGGGGGDAGSSGVVIVRYLASYADPASLTGSPDVSTIMGVPPTAISNDIVTLNDALTATGTATLTLGQLNLNNFTLTTGGLSSSNTNTRTIAFGSGSIALTGTAALAMADASNFTYTGTGNLTAAMSAVRTFTFGTTAGGSAANALNLSLTSGASVPTLTSGSWFKALNFTGTTSIPAVTTVYVDTLTLATGGTYTGLTPVFTRTQTWTSQFSKVLDGIGFNLSGGTLTLNGTQTYSATGSCNLIAGTLDLGGANLTVGRFVSNNTNYRAVAFGANNIILATTVAEALNIDMLEATGFTCTGTGGFSVAANITRRYAVGAFTVPTGAAVYTTTGTYSWTVPAGVSTICAVLVGRKSETNGNAGGSGGGGLRYINDLPVTPGETLTIKVSVGYPYVTSISRGANICVDVTNRSSTIPRGAGPFGGTIGGGNGGLGGFATAFNGFGGDGGAGGYSGNGGAGGAGSASNGSPGSSGTGGAGGGGGGGANGTNNGIGGSVGIYGEGASGAGGNGASGTGGNGSGGGYGQTSSAVRIIWGMARAFPSTLVAAEYDVFGASGGAASAANAPNLTFTGTGTAVQTFVSGSWFNNLNFGTTAFAVPATTINVNTLTLSSAGTYTGLVPVFTRTQTWTPQHSKQLGGIGVNGAGVTLTLGATQTYNPLSSKLIVNAGTVNLAGNSVDFYNFESTGSGTRAITGAGTLNIYNNWTVSTGAGFNAAGSTINMSSNNFFKTFAGGGGTYGTLVQKSAAPMTVTGSNTFENIQVSDTMSPITPPAAINFLMVAGGGGHQIGGDANAGHGGAGAGGLLYRTAYTIPTSVLTGSKTITVTVGAGGAAANGTNSTIATADNTITFTTIGGGRGGLFNGNGIAGGSGGGGGGRDYPPGDGGAAQQPASASGGVGFAGGRCRTLNDGSGTAAGGGGGGAGAAGAIGVSRQGGVGGAGLAVPIINTTTATAVGVGQVISADVWFAGGGGGQANGTGGAGGAGGGAPGASSVFQGSGVITNTQSNATGVRNGKANTGGGAGGASTGFSGYGGTGGSGVVVIRHVRIAGYEAATTGGCTVEYEGADILYIFKSSGTITF